MKPLKTGLKEEQMITNIEKKVRRFAGNEDALCNIGNRGCPFVKITGSNTAFCLLYKKELRYCETGNNDICCRAPVCLSDNCV